ncbi:MAG: hypothetical protein R3A45_10545 [Bdellovibrionota bacterium]
MSDSCTTDKYDRVGVSDVFGPSSHNWGEAFKRYGWDVSLFCGMHGDKSATSYFKGNLDSGFIDTLSTLMQDKALTSADNVFVLLNLHGKGTQQNHIVNVPLYYHIQKNSSTSTITNLSDIQKTVGIDSTAVEIEKNIYNGLVSEGWHEYRKFEVYLKTQKIIDLVELWKSQAGMVFLVSQSCFGGACVSLLSPDSEVCLNTITDLAYTIDGSYVDWLGYVLSGYRYASMDVNKKKVDEKITGQGFKSTRMKDLWAFGMRMTTNKEPFQFVGYDLPALGDEDLLSAYYLMQRSGVPLTQSEHDIFRVFQASDEWESTKMLVHEQAQRHRLVGYVQEFALLLFSEYDNDSKREKIANFSLLQASAGLFAKSN